MSARDDEASQAIADPANLADGAESTETAHTTPFTDSGVRLYVPGAHVVATRQLGQVTEALAHTLAARGIVCVYGDPGHGKTVAVHRALRVLPHRTPVHRALVAVKPALPQLRAALLTAFGLPATAPTNRTDAADRALLEAFQAPGVLVIDDVQRIAAPELDYLRPLVDAPTTQMALVLCGASAERTLARAPALAFRVLTWQQVSRLDTGQIPPCCPCSTRCGTPRQTPSCCTPMLRARRVTSVPGRRSPPTRMHLSPALPGPRWTAPF
ncbi:ATP-binding protein [Streptomyces sp. NPDC059118]|uniref:ATP-binding protein n=1 Tax=unclassified Streptomyces TaxID=2593676 RepID=UPI00367EDA19